MPRFSTLSSALLALLDRTRPVHVFVLAFLARALLVLLLPNALLGAWDSDAGNHEILARNLLSTGVYGVDPGVPDSRYPPLYIWLLAPTAALLQGPAFFVAMRLQHALLLALTSLLALRVGRDLFGPRAGAFAGLLSALYPPLVLYSATLMTDTLFVFMVAAALYATMGLLRDPRPLRSLGVGALWGLAILTREPVLLFPPVAAGLLLALSGRRALPPALLLLAGTALALAPWTYRNHASLGRWAPVTVRGPHALYVANHIPPDGRFLMDGDHISAEYARIKDDLATPWLRKTVEEAVHNLTRRPFAYLRMVGLKLNEFWLHPSGLYQLRRWPALQGSYLALHLALLVLAALGLRRAWREGPREAALPAALLAYTTVFHVFLVFPIARYCLPLLPWVGVFAGAALPRRSDA